MIYFLSLVISVLFSIFINMINNNKIGGIVTTSNPLSTAEDISKQLFDSKAKFIFTVNDLFEKVYLYFSLF